MLSQGSSSPCSLKKGRPRRDTFEGRRKGDSYHGGGYPGRSRGSRIYLLENQFYKEKKEPPGPSRPKSRVYSRSWCYSYLGGSSSSWWYRETAQGLSTLFFQVLGQGLHSPGLPSLAPWAKNLVEEAYSRGPRRRGWETKNETEAAQGGSRSACS